MRSRLMTTPGLKRLEVRFEVGAGEGATASKDEEARAALRELGLRDDLDESECAINRLLV